MSNENWMSDGKQAGGSINDMAAAAASASGGENRQPYASTAQSNAPKFMPFADVFGILDTQSNMSEEGRTYLDTVRKALEDKSWTESLRGENNVPIAISTVALNDPNNAWMFFDKVNNIGFILIFMEAIDSVESDEQRMSVYGRSRNAAGRVAPGVALLNTIGVFPEDYKRVGAMISDIKNTFAAEIRPEIHDITLQTMANCVFSINPNMSRVQEYINQVSPHGIPSTAQFGFTIDISQKKPESQRFNQGAPNKDNFETRTIAAVTGKTLIFDVGGNTMFGGMGMGNMFGGMNTGPTYLPVALITDIVSPLKAPEIMPLVITMAWNMFIGAKMWTMPFRNFGAKDALNLGNLFLDEQTGVPMTFTQEMQVYSALGQKFHQALLGFGIMEGRSRVSGTEWLSNPSMVSYAIQAFNSFIGQSVLDPNADIVAQRFPEFIGSIIDNGISKDSRYLDFLRVVADNPNEYQAAMPMLMVQNPLARLEIVRRARPDYKTKYGVQNVVFRNDALSAIANQVMNRIRVNTNGLNGQQDASYISMDGMISQAKNFNPMTIPNFGNGGFNAGNANFSQYFGYQQNM